MRLGEGASLQTGGRRRSRAVLGARQGAKNEAAGPGVSLHGVAKRFHATVALHPLDLDVAEGEFFCLLGPSGCGKTTTLNVIGGFVRPSEGSVFIRGNRVDRVPPHLRDVNTVFQSYGLFPHMTVAENLGFGLRMKGVAKTVRRARVYEAAEMVGLTGRLGAFPMELSGGQRQRVAVARALANKPAVLLLDEPLGALDRNLRKHLQGELLQIQKASDTTFVMVTHDQEEAMSMADRIAVMRDGRVEQLGSPDQIYRRPQTEFVARFMGESNLLRLTSDRGDRDVDRFLLRLVPGDVPRRWRSVTLVIRPEAVCLSPAAGQRRDSLTGTVLESTFIGPVSQLKVDIGLEAPLVVNRRASGPDQIRSGESVSISVLQDDVTGLDIEV